MNVEQAASVITSGDSRARPGLRVRRAAEPLRRGAGAVVLAAMLALLQACGGGSGGDAEAPPPSAALPELSGRFSNGTTTTDFNSLQVTVKGSVGLSRTAEGRHESVGTTDFVVSLDQLSGPYLLSDNLFSGQLFSVATGPGTANLTPLTTLLVAQLLGANPRDYSASLGVHGGFTAADDASIAAAEQRVRRILKRDYNFDVPVALGPFATTPFSRVAGDTMYDTITALVARIGTAGDISAAVTAIAQESGRCKVESTSVTNGADVDAFCPLSKTNEADATDAAIQVISFTNRRGDVLTVRLRGPAVVGLKFIPAEGAVSTCSGSACSGVTVGAPAADFTQTIGFAATPLGGAGGSIVLDGSLRTSVPGITLPGVPCTTNRYFLIHEQTRTAEGYCATPDDFGLGASGSSFSSGAARRSYTFNDGAGGPYIEVIAEGTSVVRALVYAIDPDTGTTTPLFQCRGDCAGITLGASTVNDSLGVPVVLQPIRFNRAVLAAVLPDGSLSTTDSATVEADFVGDWVDDPNALPYAPLACAATSQVATALPSDQTEPIPVCDPDGDTQGFQLRFTFVDGDGNSVFSAADLLTDGGGSYTSGNVVTVTSSATDAIVSVTFDAFNGPHYQCFGAACTGVSIAAANGAGERTITFTGTTLQELGTAGLIADRTAVLNGRMVGPPP